MSQGQVQIQKTEQKQVQTVSQQQLLQAMLTELPVNQLIDRINTEMDDNPALEVSADDNVDDIDNSLYDTSDDAVEPSGDNNADDYEARTEKEDRQTALDDALIRSVATMRTCPYIKAVSVMWITAPPNRSTTSSSSR